MPIGALTSQDNLLLEKIFTEAGAFLHEEAEVRGRFANGNIDADFITIWEGLLSRATPETAIAARENFNLENLLAAQIANSAARFGTVDQYTSQIRDLSRFEGIIKNGIRTLEDVALAEEFIRLLDPEGLGRVIDATSGIEHTITTQKENSTGAVVLGGTLISPERKIDRLLPEKGKQILLGVSDYGASLLTFIHERLHACPYEQLPVRYQLLVPPSVRQGTLIDIYSSVLGNMLLDEAISHLGEIDLGNLYPDIIKVDPHSWHYDNLRETFNKSGVDGIQSYLSDGDSYLTYKTAAFYYALLIKNGITELPTFEKVIEMMGIRVTREGGLEIPDRTKLADFYTSTLQPLMEGAGEDILTWMVRIGSENRARLQKALAYFLGSMSHAEAINFLRNDFNILVGIIGTVFGDSHPEVVPLTKTDDYKRLPDRPKQIPTSELSSTSADKVEIIGTFVGFLHQIMTGSDELIIANWNSFLLYAERCDPKSSSEVYSKLLAILEARDEKYSDGFKLYGALAVSLNKSGYISEANQLYEKALALIDEQHNPIREFISGLIENGRFDILEAYINRVVQALRTDDLIGSSQRIIRFYSLLNEIVAANDSVPDEVRNTIRVVSEKKYHESLTALQDVLKVYSAIAGEAVFSTFEEAYARIYDSRIKKPEISADSDKLTHHIRMLMMDMKIFVETLISSKESFRIGIGYLEEFPQFSEKLEIYEFAVAHIPEDFTDGERKALIESYRKAMMAQKSAVVSSYYDETGTIKPSSRRPIPDLPPNFEECHFYIHHMTKIAEALLGSTDPKIRQEGVSIIMGLSEKNLFYVNTHTDEGPFEKTLFNPSLYKARAILNNLNFFPLEERKNLLQHIFELLVNQPDSEHTRDLKTRRADAILLLAKVAAINGQDALTRQIIDLWEAGLGKKIIGEDNYKTYEFKTRILFPILKAIQNGGYGLQEMVDRIRYAASQGRDLFYTSDIVDILDFVSSDAVRGKRMSTAVVDKFIYDMASVAVDNYVRELGENTITLPMLVSELKKLPISDSQKDNLLAYLIERMTPENGIVVTENRGIEATVELYQILDFVLGNEKTPNAEKALLKNIAIVAKSFGLSIKDIRSQAVLRAFNVFFPKITSSAEFSPENRKFLVGLRSTEEFAAALKEMFAFISTADSHSKYEDIVKVYSDAISSEDLTAIQKVKFDILTLIRKELAEMSCRMGDEYVTYIPLGALSISFVGTIYSDWKKALQSGNNSLAVELFDLWSYSTTVDELKLKRLLYYDALLDPSIDLSFKRKIFEQLSEFNEISEYKKLVWKKIVESGDSEKESIFYELISPVTKDHAISKFDFKISIDQFISLVIESDPEFARGIIDSFRKFRDNGGEFTGNPVSASSIFDLIIYSYFKRGFGLYEFNPSGRIIELAATAICLKYDLLNPDAPEGTASTKLESELSIVFGESYDPEDKISTRNLLKAVRNLLKWEQTGPLPSEAELDSYLNLMRPLMERVKRSYDEVLASELEMPAAFKGKGELADFLLSRFYLTLSVPQQNELLPAIRDVTPEEAFKAFFEKTGLEKIGQFLSFWPDIPLDIRAQLSGLQDSIAPSDFYEVKETIRKELTSGGAAPEIIDSILSNLQQKPLGSGSIGECYLSKLPDGRVIVVKVVPPTKERKFRAALEHVRKVRYVLNLYAEKIPGAKEALRLIDLFVPMVLKELDLRSEVSHMETMRRNLPEGIEIPQNIPELAREKVLVQSFVRGVKVSEISDPALRNKIMDRIRDAFMKQVLEDGIYHSDLQPGNFLYDAETDKIILLDFGQVGELSIEQRKGIEGLITACGSSDSLAIADALLKMSEQPANYDRDKLVESIKQIVAEGEILSDISGFVMKLFRAAHDSGLLIELPYLHLLKGMATFEFSSKAIVEGTNPITGRKISPKTEAKDDPVLEENKQTVKNKIVRLRALIEMTTLFSERVGGEIAEFREILISITLKVAEAESLIEKDGMENVERAAVLINEAEAETIARISEYSAKLAAGRVQGNDGSNLFPQAKIYLSSAEIKAISETYKIMPQSVPDLVARASSLGFIQEMNEMIAERLTPEAISNWLATPEGQIWLMNNKDILQNRAREGIPGLSMGIVTLLGAEEIASVIGLDPKYHQFERFAFVISLSHLANKGTGVGLEILKNIKEGRPFQLATVNIIGEGNSKMVQFVYSDIRNVFSKGIIQALTSNFSTFGKAAMTLSRGGISIIRFPYQMSMGMGLGLISSKITSTIMDQILPGESKVKEVINFSSFFVPDVARIIFGTFPEGRLGSTLGYLGRAFGAGFLVDLVYSGVGAFANGQGQAYENFVNMRAMEMKEEAEELNRLTWKDAFVLPLLMKGLHHATKIVAPQTVAWASTIDGFSRSKYWYQIKEEDQKIKDIWKHS